MSNIKARIVPDLLAAIEVAMPDEGHRNDPAFLSLAERIQGQVVSLKFIGNDAFEAEDDNYWLPENCWAALQEQK